MEAHTQCLNDISWYPQDNRLFFTIGDDQLLKIWGQPGMSVISNTDDEKIKVIPVPRYDDSCSCDCSGNEMTPGEETLSDDI